MYIPESVESNYNLSPNEKYLYGLILQSSDNKGICTETNSFFAAQIGGNFGVTERTIRNYLKKLKNESLITVASIGKLKNAIFVVNREHIDEISTQKNEPSKLSGKIEQFLEKIFHLMENKHQNATSDNPILNTIYDLLNLVLVSENKNNNINNNAGARTRSTVNNLNTFANYKEAGKTERVKHYDFATRHPYTHILFKEFFDHHPAGIFFETGKEVVDVMITAYEQSKTQDGLKFWHRTWRAGDLVDAFFNITSYEFASIVNSAVARNDIRVRNCYILASILQTGNTVKWSKTMELVEQGYPWDYWIPGQKPLSDMVIQAQERVRHEKQNKQFEKEFAGVVPATQLVRGCL